MSFFKKKGKSSSDLDKHNSDNISSTSKPNYSSFTSELERAGSLRDLHVTSNKYVGEKLENHDAKLSPNLSRNRNRRRSTVSLMSKFKNSSTSLNTIKESFSSFLPWHRSKKKIQIKDDTCSAEKNIHADDVFDNNGDTVYTTDMCNRLSLYSNESECSENNQEADYRDRNKLKNSYQTKIMSSTDTAMSNSSGIGSNFRLSASSSTVFHAIEPGDNYSSDDTEEHIKGQWLPTDNDVLLVNEETQQLNKTRQYQSMVSINVSSSDNVNITLPIGASSRADSMPTSSASEPQLWPTFGSMKPLERIRVKTESQFAAHEKKGHVMDTRAVRECHSELKNKSGKRVFLILGHEKDGKSCTAKNILYKLQINKKRKATVWETFLIVSPTEWNDIDAHGKFDAHGKYRKVAVLIDNIFGTLRFDAKKCEEWSSHFDDMCSAASKGNVAVVLPINKRIYDQYCATPSSHELFTDSKIIDLTSGEFRYTFEEKLEMMENSLQIFPGAKEVQFRSNKNDENIETFEPGNVLSISNETLKNNVEASTQFAYPQQVKEYCSNKTNIVMRSEFFTYPLLVHYATIKTILNSDQKRDKESILALATVFMNQKIKTGSLDTYVAKIKREGDRNAEIKKQKGKMKQVKVTLLEKLADRLDSGTALIDCLKRGIEYLSGWLLKQDENGIVTFTSHLIYNTVGVVCSEMSEDDVIREANEVFLDKFVRPLSLAEPINKLPKIYQRGIFISTLQSTTTETIKALQLRFAKEIISNTRIKDTCGHPIMRQLWFAEKFLTHITNEAKTAKFLQSVENNKTVLYYGINHTFEGRKPNDPLNLAELLVKTKFLQKNMKKDPMMLGQQRIALKHACDLGIVSTFDSLYKQFKPTRNLDYIRMAVDSCSPELIVVVLSNRPFFNQDDLRKILREICKRHCSENTEVGKQLARPILNQLSSSSISWCEFVLKDTESDENHSDLDTFITDLRSSINVTKRQSGGSVQSI